MAYSTSSPRRGTQWVVGSEYSSSFVAPSQYILEPDVRSRIFDAYREDTLYDFLIHSNRRKVTKQTEFFHHEFDSLWHLHTVESKSGTNGANNAVTVTLEEIDHLGATGSLSQLKKKDLVLVFTSTGVKKGYVTATNKTVDEAHTVTIKPSDSSVDIVSAVTAGDSIGIFSAGASDAAGQTSPTSRVPVNFSNYVQIIDTQKVVHGSESANQSFVVVNGKPYFYAQQVIDGDLEQRLKIEGAFIFGHKGTQVDPDTSLPAYFTGGLEYWADTEGYAEPYTTSFALGELDNICKNLDRERAGLKHMMLVGNDLDLDLDKFVRAQFTNATIDWTNMGLGDAASRMIDFGVDGFRYNNRIFMKKVFAPFNYLGSTSVAASPYPTMGFTLPWERVADAKGEDEVDSICLRFKENDRGSRFMAYWERDKKITNEDKIEFNWKSECGIQIALARHINKIYKA